MHHLFWVYRRRSSDEAAADTRENNRREYQSLSQLFLSRWPGLNLKTTPGQGAGVRVFIQADRPTAAIERFLLDCIESRNAQEPAARLALERTQRRRRNEDGELV
ncbi:MAG: hypothetical protein JWP29_5531 [Rhodoferax sp.]|nr:hypothetical protein [Rhodoferax sp.]